MLRSLIFALMLLPMLLGAVAAGAVAVDTPLADPALEARARDLHKQLRCLVCQNQSIEDSNAELARDLRLLVRERLQAGDSDEATIAFIVDRYGDWVLLQPPFKAGTILLWAAPLLLLCLGLVVAVIWFRQRRVRVGEGAAAQSLSEGERERLEKILSEDPGP